MVAGSAERRARLDREAVLLAAEDVVDRVGYDSLTMTVLAAALETRVSSLYNHVANLEELRSDIQIRAMLLLGRRVQRAAMGHAGAEGLHELCHELRRFAQEHPQRYAAMTRRPIDAASFYAAAGGVIEAVGVMVRSTGVPEELIVPTGMAAFSALHGFVSLEAAGFFTGVDELDDVYEQVVRGAVAAAVPTA